MNSIYNVIERQKRWDRFDIKRFHVILQCESCVVIVSGKQSLASVSACWMHVYESVMTGLMMY